jgi:hypothetical protein
MFVLMYTGKIHALLCCNVIHISKQPIVNSIRSLWDCVTIGIKIIPSFNTPASSRQSETVTALVLYVSQ